MVGTDSRKNVITLTGGTPGPHSLHTSAEAPGAGPTPSPAASWRAPSPLGPLCPIQHRQPMRDSQRFCPEPTGIPFITPPWADTFSPVTERKQ